MFACFYSAKHEAEKAELQDYLDRTTALNDDLRKKLELLTRDREDLVGAFDKLRQDNVRLSELNTSQQHEAEKKRAEVVAHLTKENERVKRDFESKLAISEEEKQSQAKRIDKLQKDKEKLKSRVDRMGKALAMLEVILDETLMDANAHHMAKTHERIRQSKGAVQELLRDPVRAPKSGPVLPTIESAASLSGPQLDHDTSRDQSHLDEAESSFADGDTSAPTLTPA